MRTLLVCLGSCLISFPCYAPTDMPWLPVVRHKPDIIERVIHRSGIPSHLITELIWEESRLDPGVPPRHEDNGTCSWGLFQINGSCNSIRNQEADIQTGMRYIEHWWEKTEGDWHRSKLAYRAGHL